MKIALSGGRGISYEKGILLLNEAGWLCNVLYPLEKK